MRTGSFVHRAWAQGATLKVRFPRRVSTVISSQGHWGRSAAAAHQSARWMHRYMSAGMLFLNRAWYRVPSSFAAIPSSRSEEHTSELQSRGQLVCRLLLEKKKPTPI